MTRFLKSQHLGAKAVKPRVQDQTGYTVRSHLKEGKEEREGSGGEG